MFMNKNNYKNIKPYIIKANRKNKKIFTMKNYS